MSSIDTPLSLSSHASSPPTSSPPSPSAHALVQSFPPTQANRELGVDSAVGGVESPGPALPALEGGHGESKNVDVEQHPGVDPEDDPTPESVLSDQLSQPLHHKPSNPSPSLAGSAVEAAPKHPPPPPFPPSNNASPRLVPFAPRRPLIPAFELTATERLGLDEMERAVAQMDAELSLTRQASVDQTAFTTRKSRFLSLPTRHLRSRKASQSSPALDGVGVARGRGPASRARELLETLLPRRNHLSFCEYPASLSPESTCPIPPAEETRQPTSHQPPSSPTRSTLFSRQSDHTSFESSADKSGADSVHSSVQRHTFAAPARRQRPDYVFRPEERDSLIRQESEMKSPDPRRHRSRASGSGDPQSSRVWSLRGASSTLSRDEPRPSRSPLLARSASRASVTLRSGAGQDWARENERRWLGDDDDDDDDASVAATPSQSPPVQESHSRTPEYPRATVSRSSLKTTSLRSRRSNVERDDDPSPSTSDAAPSTPSSSPAFQESPARYTPAYPRATVGRSSMKTSSLRSRRSNIEGDDASLSSSRLRLRGKSSSTNNWYPTTPERSTHRQTAKEAKVSFVEVTDRDEDGRTSSMSKVHAMDKLEIFFLYAAIKTDLAGAKLERDALADSLNESRAALSSVHSERDALATNLREERSALKKLKKFQFPPMDTKSPPTGAETKALLLSRQSWEKHARETLADAESAHAEVEALRVVVAEGQDREGRLRRELQHQWENVAAQLVI